MSVDFNEFSRRMDKTLEVLGENFGSVRAGRANAKVLDRISVEYYGQETPLNGVATISSPDARTLVIQPWDANCSRTSKRPSRLPTWASTPRMTAGSSGWCSPSLPRSAGRT